MKTQNYIYQQLPLQQVFICDTKGNITIERQLHSEIVSFRNSLKN